MTTAAAVCLRRGPVGLEVLLIRTSSGKRYIFPKGHVEEGEKASDAALRELREEAGYEGVLDRGADGCTRAIVHEGRYYLLVKDAKPIGSGEPERNPTWFSLPKAIEALYENRPDEEARELFLALKQVVKWYSAN